MVYIFDDEHIKVVNYLNSGVDKSIERVRLDETKEVLERLKGVQTQSPLVHQIEKSGRTHKARSDFCLQILRNRQ